MKKVASSLLITFILIAIFAGLFKFPPITQAAEVPNLWVQDSTLVSGLGDIGGYSSPAIAYNVTGDNNWTLIAGCSDGIFVGYYWNGSQWLGNSTYVAGLSDIGSYSSPTLAFNVTGDGNWTFITGRSDGTFAGYYWNGTQWVSDTSRVAGLGDIGSYSTPSLAYNLLGDGKWALISGETAGGSYGFYWNSTQWISNSSLITGLEDIGSRSHPTMAYNLLGNDKWVLICGVSGRVSYGFYWNGTQWVWEGLIVANEMQDTTYKAPALVYNLQVDGKWVLLYGENNGVFYGFKRETPPTGKTLELERLFLRWFLPDVSVYAIAESANYLYLGTNTAPCKIVKVDKSTFEPVAYLTLDAGQNYAQSDCMLNVSDYLYVGLADRIIVKIDLSNFTKSANLTLASDDGAIYALDTDGNFLYCATGAGFLVRVNITSFTRVDRISLSASATIIYIHGQYLYAGLGQVFNQYARVDKVDLSSFTLNATLAVGNINGNVNSITSDSNWLYVAHSAGLRRVNLTTFENDANLGTGLMYDMVVSGSYIYGAFTYMQVIYLPTFLAGETFKLYIDCYDMCMDSEYVYVVAESGTTGKFYIAEAVLHSVTITANPSISVHFSIGGYIYTTPYVTNVPQGSHTFQVVDVFPKSGNFFLIFEHWTFNGVVCDSGAYATITKTITSTSNLVIYYHVGVLELKFEDDFETGNLDKWTGTDRQTNKYDHETSTVDVTGTAKYAGSYGLQANGVTYAPGYGSHAFAYKRNSPMNYVYLNFMVYVPTGQTRGWFGLLRPDGLTMTLSETGYTDTPDCTQFSVGWRYSSKFEVVYWRGGVEYIKDDISGFQFDKWFNITMFLKTGSDGLYAFWVDGVLKWYRFHDDTSLWGGYSSYVGARAWTESKTNYVDDVKISAFVDPTFVTLTVNSTPLETVAFTINGAQYYTPTSILLMPQTYQLAVVDTFPMINETRYAFTHWSKMASPQIDIYAAAFDLVLAADTNLTIHYSPAVFLKPSPPVVLEEITYCLPLIFYILMVIMFFAGLYFYKQRETWKIGIPLILIALWLIIFEPKTPIDEMPIVLLRYFTVPPWHLYMGLILTIIAAALLLSKTLHKK